MLWYAYAMIMFFKNYKNEFLFLPKLIQNLSYKSFIIHLVEVGLWFMPFVKIEGGGKAWQQKRAVIAFEKE